MKIISWNANGLRPRLAEFLHYLDKEKETPAILCIQETWIYSEILPDIEGYNNTHSFRTNKKGGGSAIYIKKNIDYCVLDKIQFDNVDIEVAGIKIYNCTNEPFVVLSIYIAPSQILKDEHLKRFLVKKNLLILGDFNAKNPLWGSPITDVRGKLIGQFLEDNNIFCLNNGDGTRFKKNGTTSHLDLALCSSNLGTKIECEVSEDNFGSDHYPLIISYAANNSSFVETFPTRYNYKKADWELFKSTLQSDYSLDYKVTDSEEAYCKLVAAYLKAREICVPVSKGIKKHKYSPFWNDECSIAKNNRRLAEKVL